MAVTKIKPVKSALKRALDYIQNPDKTDEKMLVSSFGCGYETAFEEFELTLSKARPVPPPANPPIPGQSRRSILLRILKTA